MLRITAGLACFLPLVAVAAPAPPPSKKETLAKHWGKTEGEGEFEVNGKQLTIRTIGKPAHGLIGIIGQGQITMPRTSRTITGDFEATVKIEDAALPNKNAKNEGSWPGTRAGVYIEGGGYAVELHLYQYFPTFNGVVEENPTRCVWVDTWFPRGGAGSQLANIEAGKSTYLRITRKDKTVNVSYSSDGKTWSKSFNPRQALEFPGDVTVGVFFSHSTYQIATATFDPIIVEKLKP